MDKKIIIERQWAMPSRHTFSIKPIQSLILKTVQERKVYKGITGGSMIIDPFCGGRTDLADINNDLDPNVQADYHLDALDFLQQFESGSIDGVLFDPPYSPRQVSECYNKLGKTVNMQTTQASYWSKLKVEIGRIVMEGGFCITCGWNSGGIGIKYGFDISEILLVPHGGWHNDTIVTLEFKRKNNR